MSMFKILAAATPCIYVVDDAPFLTELYISLLQGSGYNVRAFNDRAEALTALKADWNKPDLLISDYRGLSMSVDQFLQQCLLVHPALRILMVSGCRRKDIHFSRASPDRFIEKPFALEEFQREVKGLLAA